MFRINFQGENCRVDENFFTQEFYNLQLFSSQTFHLKFDGEKLKKLLSLLNTKFMNQKMNERSGEKSPFISLYIYEAF